MTRLVRIGYWRGTTSPNHPDPADFVDETWDERDRDQVAAYLQSGTIPWVGAGFSPCRICGAPNGSAEFTDGTYIWPEGLAHYVEVHHVRLPEEVLAHIRQRWDELLEAAVVDDDWWLCEMTRR
ncbi:MAG: hypothetical protein M3P34_08095 [Actinomycetota bacterium]|nr:hypothetical protein [Actinomycetota bacterium]